VYPAFGMAELVIGGTFPEPMQGLRVDRVDRDAARARTSSSAMRRSHLRRARFLGPRGARFDDAHRRSLFGRGAQ
jgi:hypothetical protein